VRGASTKDPIVSNRLSHLNVPRYVLMADEPSVAYYDMTGEPVPWWVLGLDPGPDADARAPPAAFVRDAARSAAALRRSHGALSCGTSCVGALDSGGMSDAPPPRKVIRVKRVTGAREPATIEERIEAVWQLTLTCLAWKDGGGEPRLDRSVARVRRPGR
jgi:hypothetical protein